VPQENLPDYIMNFDRLAPYYNGLECLLAGGLMQRCRTTFLPETKNCRNALLVGEGTGKFLVELLRFNPHLKITCVEHSEKMIRQARQRLARARLDSSQLHFKHMDALDWTPTTEKFDLVATHFFLDCFRAGQLEKLVPLLAKSTAPGAIWLLADFQMPGRGLRRIRARMIIAALYLFFRFSTSLPASRLTPPDNFLRAAGFVLLDRRLKSLGLVHSDIWQKSDRAHRRPVGNPIRGKRGFQRPAKRSFRGSHR